MHFLFRIIDGSAEFWHLGRISEFNVGFLSSEIRAADSPRIGDMDGGTVLQCLTRPVAETSFDAASTATMCCQFCRTYAHFFACMGHLSRPKIGPVGLPSDVFSAIGCGDFPGAAI
jgi:hypothetical protein